MEKRSGIIAGGNWIIDHIKIIDKYPVENMLVTIREQIDSLGGGAYNVLACLSKLNAGLHLSGMGLTGDDKGGKQIHNTLNSLSVDTSNMKSMPKINTSYTDVMTDISTGSRTFFHYHGTNSYLDQSYFDGLKTDARIFHLAYLLLLDRLEEPDEQYGVKGARVLKQLKETGLEISVDMVSQENDRYSGIVIPCLPYIDYLIINEMEAGFITGLNIRNGNLINSAKLVESINSIKNKGNNKLIIIHFPEGALAVEKTGNYYFVPSFKISLDKIKGSVGAGDAFCAGCLYGIHEGWPVNKILSFAHGSAWFNLQDSTAVGGAQALDTILDFINKGTQNEAVVVL